MEEKNNNQNMNINCNKDKSIKETNDIFPQFSDILSISSNPEELFTLLYPIGHGGFGTVYKAVHNSTNTVVAIKILNFIQNNSQIDNKKNLSSNFFSAQQETSMMKLGSKSKYIVNYYGSYYSRKSNTLWLILEYCSSGSVIDLMQAMNRKYSEIEISTIIENVLQGLIIIHSMNLIHRDIKGANILLSEDGYAKIGDFGVGIRLPESLCYRNSKKGSPYWMSPQVVKNINYDMKTDIWSLGITCAELWDGKPPFSDLNPKNAMEKIASCTPTVNDVINRNEHSEEFYDFVKQCLEVDPQKRPSAKELINHKFITRYSRGNKFLSELVSKHAEDILKYRKMVNEKNKIKDKVIEKNENFEKYNNNCINSNKKEIIYCDIVNMDNIENLNNDNNVNEEGFKLTLGQKNILNEEEPQQIMVNQSNGTSHFNYEGKVNFSQQKDKLLNNSKIFSPSDNLENNAINSTKSNEIDSQKYIQNITNINIYSDKIKFNDYNSNNIKTDSFNESNRQNFITFHIADNEQKTNNEKEKEESYEIHHGNASFENNYKYFENDKNKKNSLFFNQYTNNDFKIRLIKNNNFFKKPLLNKEKMNLLFDDNIFDPRILYKNKENVSNRNKSTENIFIYKKKSKEHFSKKILSKTKTNNFIYTKPKIKSNNKMNNIYKKSKSFDICENNESNTIENTNNKKNNIGLNEKKEINKRNIFNKLDIFDDNSIYIEDEGSINKANLFKTKSNFSIFTKDIDKNKNFFGTNYNFYKNKNFINLLQNNINKNERINNYSDINDCTLENSKFHVNKSKNMNKMHQKYFEK